MPERVRAIFTGVLFGLLRQHAGMTQTDLAQAAAVGQSTVCRLEGATAKPSPLVFGYMLGPVGSSPEEFDKLLVHVERQLVKVCARIIPELDGPWWERIRDATGPASFEVGARGLITFAAESVLRGDATHDR